MSTPSESADPTPESEQPSGITDEPLEVSDQQLDEVEHHLHRSTLWIPMVEQIRQVFIPIVIACFVVGPWFAIPGALVFVVLPVGIYHWIRFITVTFVILPDELVIRSGWLALRERRIPWKRVQETESQQSLIRRPFALTRLNLKTAGSDEQEASLDVITVEQAEQIRHAVATAQQRIESSVNGEDSMEAAAETADVVCTLSIRDLIIGGLTSNLVASLFAILGAVFYFQVVMGDGWQGFGSRWFSWRRNVPGPAMHGLERLSAPVDRMIESVHSWIPNLGPLNPLVDWIFSETLFKSVLIACSGLIGSALVFVVRYYGFRLQRRGDVMSFTHGLLTIHSGGFARRRIQSLKLEEGLLRRMLGLASIRVDSAGDHEQIDENKKRDVLVPSARRELARSVAAQAMPGLNWESAQWQRVSPLAIARGTKKGSLLVLGAMLQIYFWRRWSCLMLAPGFVLVYLLNQKWYLHTGYWLAEKHFVFRHGWLNRSTLCLPIANIQNVVLSQSPFDRRLRLATLTIDTAGQSNTGGGPVIRNLTLRDARRLQQQLIQRVVSRFADVDAVYRDDVRSAATSGSLGIAS